MPAWLIQLIVQALIGLIGNLEEQEDCPGGVCDVGDDLRSLNADLTGPSAQGIGDWIGCVDWLRLINAVKEIISVIRDAMNQCPPIGEVESE